MTPECVVMGTEWRRESVVALCGERVIVLSTPGCWLTESKLCLAVAMACMPCDKPCKRDL